MTAFEVRDTKGYPDDKDPSHWRRINGAPVHIDNEGNIDGGAGGKFAGKQWNSSRHPHKQMSQAVAPQPKVAAPKATPLAAPKAAGALTGYKGHSYTQAVTGADANTPAGKVHNLIVGYIDTLHPTREDIADAADYIADEDLNMDYLNSYKKYETAEKMGNKAGVAAFQKEVQDAVKAIKIAQDIANKMSAPQTTTSPKVAAPPKKATVGIKTQSSKLAAAIKDKSLSAKLRIAITTLGGTAAEIEKSLKKAHTDKGFTSLMLQDEGTAHKLVEKISSIAGEKYYLETVLEDVVEWDWWPGPKKLKKLVLKAKKS